jgi:hypothetical protein
MSIYTLKGGWADASRAGSVAILQKTVSSPVNVMLETGGLQVLRELLSMSYYI